MKTIYLCDVKENINQVFPNYVKESLVKETDIDPNVYSKEDLLANPQNFGDVEYVFSTWGMTELNEEEIKTLLPSLKCVFYAAGSVQYFARPYLNCGVKVFSAWAANAIPVAEYTVARIVLANKGFYKHSKMSCPEDYETMREGLDNYVGNFNAKIGIIGAGMIGKLVIEMLKDYKFEVLVFDPFLPDEKAEELGVKKVSLEEIFSECNVVSNHLANNEQTKNMMNYSHFVSMPPYSTFLNTGRGAQLIEADLVKALKERPDIFAVLDVTEPEPSKKGHEFYTLDNCILTPHIAGSTGREVHRMAEYALGELRLFEKGEKSKYEVDLKMLETMA